MIVELIAHGYDEAVAHRDTLQSRGYVLATSRNRSQAKLASYQREATETTAEYVCRHAEILVYRMHVVYETSDYIYVPAWVLEVLKHRPSVRFMKLLATDEVERKAWLMEMHMKEQHS